MVKTSKERGYTPIAIEFRTETLDRLRADARGEQRSVAFLVRRIVAQHYAEIDAGRGEHYVQTPARETHPADWRQVIPASAPQRFNLSTLHKSMGDSPKPSDPQQEIEIKQAAKTAPPESEDDK
jgi:hypothetical protein